MHRGRSYPLGYHRGWNGSAPYPNWIARRYEVNLPPCSGTLAPFLSDIFFTTDMASIDGNKLLFEHDFSVPSFGLAFFFKLRLWWENISPLHQRWDLTMTYLQAIPPAAGVLSAWKRETLPEQGRQVEVLLNYFNDDAAAYLPLGQLGVIAEGYHLGV